MSLQDDEDDANPLAPPQPEDVEVDAEPDAPDEVSMNADGSADVTLEDAKPGLTSEHYANLAEELEPHELSALGMELCELVEEDLQAREPRDKIYEVGIQRTGFGDDAPGGAQFTGASKVSHPMLGEACVDFQARAVKELLPPTGPVKDQLIGRVTKEKVDKARRKTEYMNWQFCHQIPSFLTIFEQFLIQLPMGGSQYIKGPIRDDRMKRPYYQFVSIDDVILPYAANDYFSAQRRTQRLYYTDLDCEQRIRDDEWRAIDLGYASITPEKSGAAEAQDRVEGKQEGGENRDGLRAFYEVDALLDLGLEGEDAGPMPYLVTVQVEDHQVVSIYRNWDEGDEKLARIDRLNTAPFIPWEGPYGLGFPQMIGGLTAAATGALRALLDSAHIANAPTALKLKSSVGGQTPQVQIGQVTEIEGSQSIMDPDIRKIAMPLPFPGPNAVLFQLLGFLVDAGRGVVRTALEDTNEGPNTPVGTTLARIQEGMVVFSAIHRRLHDFMGRLLKGLHRYNAIYLSDHETVEELGELIVYRKDFKGPMDVVPVSDPNIFSDMQRTAQVQLVQSRAAALAPLGIYDLRKVEERFLEQMKIPAWKELLTPKPEPMEMNAVNENVAAMMGRPIVAFPEQDHLAHLQAHLEFLQSPTYGANPMVAPKVSGPIVQHVLEHMAFWYTTAVYEAANEVAAQAGVEDVADVLKSKNAKDKQALDRLLATVNTDVLKQAGQVFQKVPPIIQQVQQFLQSLAPPPPIDPVTVAKMDVERRAAADQAKNQLEQTKLQQTGQEGQAKLGLSAQELQLKGQHDQQVGQEKMAEQIAKDKAEFARREDERAKQAAEDERERANRESDLRFKLHELQLTTVEAARDHALERERLVTESATRERELRADLDKARLAAQTKVATNDADNRTALELAELKNKQVSTGTGLGSGPNPQP